tara:strand:+ start:25 stop:315 length:291 start_codon:yes stop_codon:yes gene_type:complete
MILNINPFKLGQYACYIGLFTFIFLLLDSNPLTDWAFYCMIFCMMGIDYFSFFNGSVQGADKAIEQFNEQLNIREQMLNELNKERGELNANKLNNK